MKISKSVMSLVPYKPGKSLDETKREYNLKSVIKLASNESPIGVSKKVLAALQEEAQSIHYYPDPSCFNLKKAMSEYYNVKGECLTFGNGSNELIDLLIRIFCEPNESILTSKGAFIAYKVCAKAARVNVIESELTPDLKFDVKALIELYKKHQPNLVFIANPNNPTGTYLNTNEVEELMSVVGNDENCLVVFDEAYNEFVRAKDYPDSVEIFKKYKNVVILRTLSKVFGLAGLRLGTLIGRPEVLDFVDRVRNPFNVNSLAQAAAIAVISDVDYISKACKVNWQGLDYIYDRLNSLNVHYWKSQANFVLIDVKTDSNVVYEELLKRGVILRPVNAYGFNTHLRMSVGLESENKTALDALEEILSK